jgi:tetratricopeptide (TPR) repeat protein
MKRLFFLLMLLSYFMTAGAQNNAGQKAGNDKQTSGLIMPYLKDCKSSATDAERYQCTLDNLLKVLGNRFECPWQDLEGEYSRIILRFMVNNEGNLEKFLTLYSDNSANRESETFNTNMIKAVYTTNGDWVPVKESGKTMQREFILPVECNCSDKAKPVFKLMDTIPAYFSDGHFQLEGFIGKNIVYPDGFLSKSGRQTTALLKANINTEGKLDTTSIRVINLNSIDYRLSENAIQILLNLAKKSWKPATVRGGGPVDFEMYFKVTYVDDKNPRKGAVPMDWDITVGNNHFFNAGAMEFSSQNFNAAIELFKRAVFLDPDDKESWLMLGQSYIGARNNSQARIALKRAMDLGVTEAEKWMKEAEKPDAVEPPKLPDKEIKKRPDKTEKVRAASYGGHDQGSKPPQGQQPQSPEAKPESNPEAKPGTGNETKPVTNQGKPSGQKPKTN